MHANIDFSWWFFLSQFPPSCSTKLQEGSNRSFLGGGWMRLQVPSSQHETEVVATATITLLLLPHIIMNRVKMSTSQIRSSFTSFWTLNQTYSIWNLALKLVDFNVDFSCLFTFNSYLFTFHFFGLYQLVYICQLFVYIWQLFVYIW